MAIYLDDQAVELDGKDVAAVLEQARQRLGGGRVVVEVAIDGQVVTGDELDQRMSEAIGDREVRLVSAEPRELAAAALLDVRGRLGEARTLQDEAADLLQRDEAGQALQKVAKAIEAWLQTQQAVVHAAMLGGVDLESLTVEGEDIGGYTQELADQLKELKELITSGDHVGLADALAYEWPRITDRWDELIGGLIERVQAAEEQS